MPSGKNHDRITLWLLPVVLAGTFRVTLQVPLTVLVSITFLLGGFMFGPDLDIWSVQSRRWGPLSWLWYPYRKMIKHRSVWSHGPVVGTVVRVIYLGLWVALVLGGVLGIIWLIGPDLLSWVSLKLTVWSLAVTHWPLGVAGLIGLELGACSHYVSDWLVSTVQRWMRKRRRKPQRRRKR